LEFFEIFPWNKNFETGIDLIDEQHKQLVHILNQLAAHLANRSNPVTLNEIFKQLADYACYHFETEEQIWTTHFKNDEWYTNHEKTHESFIEKITLFQSSCNDKPLDDVIHDVVSFLSHWLAYHILDTDKRMAKAVLSLQSGHSLDTAKHHANAEMNGSMKVLINTVLTMYDSLSSRTLDLMREKALRKQAEEALLASEERLKFILDGSADGIWDWDIEQGVTYQSNDDEISIFQIISDTPEETERESTIHPADIRRIKADLQAHLDGKTEFFINKHRVLRKNTSWSWILTRGKITSRDQDGKPLHMVGTHSNVTERELASIIYAYSSQAMLVTDVNNIIISTNPAFTKVSGYTEQDIIGKSPNFLASSKYDKSFYLDMCNSIQSKGYWKGEVWCTRKNGEPYLISLKINTVVDTDGAIDHHIALFSDITKYKEVESTGLKTSELSNLIIQEAPIGIAIYNETGQCITANSAFAKINDSSIEQALSQNYTQLDSWQASHLADYAKEALATNTVQRFKLPFKPLPHKDIFIEGIFTPLKASDSQNLLLLIDDISLPIQLEEQLRRAQKLDALGKLTGGIAHDFNNIIGIIGGYTGLLKNIISDQPKAINYTDQIQRASDRAAKLTLKLLSFSQPRPLNASLVNINTLLLSLQHMLTTTLTPRIKLELDLSTDLWPVYLDSNDFEDAIVNMSINAMHAIEKNGYFHIHTFNQLLTPLDAQVLNLEAGDYVVLKLSDNGCGMDNETKEKIFEPFYTTKGEKGSGLGLSQVYGFVIRSNGSIQVQAQTGQGSHFSLFFPRSTLTEPTEKDEPSHHNNTLTGHENILVVDDEDSLLALSAEILQLDGYQVFTAESAQQALKILETEKINLLLSDVIMPEMDGYQLASIVTKQYPDIKILLFSGYSEHPYENLVDADLHDNLLRKPFTSNALRQRVRDLLNS